MPKVPRTVSAVEVLGQAHGVGAEGVLGKGAQGIEDTGGGRGDLQARGLQGLDGDLDLFLQPTQRLVCLGKRLHAAL